MTQSIYCSMIHGGLNLSFKPTGLEVEQCCLRKPMVKLDTGDNIWNNDTFQTLRKLNIDNQWSPGCKNCKSLEAAQQISFRNGTNDGLGIYGQTDLAGPSRIDLTFDISCNLACRICDPQASTFWQKHLKEHGQWEGPIFSSRNKQRVIETLGQLDLSNLKMLVFCGGETLLGNEYWEVAEWLANNVPNAKQQLTLCFQTNGTQPIHEKHYKTIEKFFLVKLHISIDGVGEQFEYMRWPAKWNSTVDNIKHLQDSVPSNVMFLIEETVSIFNLAYLGQLDEWVEANFATNREGDIVNHTKHMAYGIFSLDSLSEEYASAIRTTKYQNLVSDNFKESREKIQSMIKTIKQFDQYRNQDFTKTFPLLKQYYSRWLD